jgi:hypothetical protein
MIRLIQSALAIIILAFAHPASAAPSFGVSCGKAIEGSSAPCTVTKSAKGASYSKVKLETHGGGSATYGVDFTPVSVTLTFGNNELTKSVQVPTIQDTAIEGDETFTVAITAVRFASIAQGAATATILDDDTAAPPAPPAPALGQALALSGCPALNRPESIIAGHLYEVAGFAGYSQPGDPPPPPGTQDIVILSDGGHLGDGWFALYVPASCVRIGS